MVVHGVVAGVVVPGVRVGGTVGRPVVVHRGTGPGGVLALYYTISPLHPTVANTRPHCG